jgi:hypothetical protein
MTDLEKSIIQELPQVPYVIDQIDEALKWAKEVLTEGEYNKMLEVTYDVTEFVKSISEPAFFKIHYVIASILSNIENPKADERFQKFDTASKAVEKALDDLTIVPESIEKIGCFKSIMLHLTPLASKNIDLFTIGLIGVKHDLMIISKGMKEAKVKTPITANDYISVLGYALVMANIRMSKINMSKQAYEIYNDILVMLNSDFNY